MATISACRRDTWVPGTTTSAPASRPNRSAAVSILYSRPSVRQTTRPPVVPVGFAGPPGFALAGWRSVSLTAEMYVVLPLSRSSANSSSSAPMVILSPCSSGWGIEPRRTPLTSTTPLSSARRMVTDLSAPVLSTTGRWGTPGPFRRRWHSAPDPTSISPAGTGCR